MTWLLSLGPWWFALIGVPILIHLINMMRHKRVKWAAMDFLLQSQKKHRRWIILKQLLLLLLRMAAVAAILLMLMPPTVGKDWSDLIAGGQTHHIVLLDDSFSMSDRTGETNAFHSAKEGVEKLTSYIAQRGGKQTFSLIRFSQAKDARLDLIQENIDAKFDLRIRDHLAPIQPSQTAAIVNDAVEAIDDLPPQGDDEQRIIYLLTDFRSPQWNEPTELLKKLSELKKNNAELHFIQCVKGGHPNLAILSLQPEIGTQAAGVELFINLAVKNYGPSLAKDVAVRLEEDGHTRPGLVIESISPGETINQRFRVNFPTAGEHAVTASLPSDAIEADSHRYSVLDIPDAVPVLIIDSDRSAVDGYFLATSFDPGGTVKMGLAPQVERPTFLRKKEELKKFSTIFVLNLKQLDDSEVETLEQFAKAGGGVAFFMGEQSRGTFFNKRLYRDGEGIFPLPVTLPTDLLVDRSEKSPDMEFTKHPVFHTFAAMRNNPLDAVTVQRYFAVPASWKAADHPQVQVVARLRNGAPLMVEKKYGEGRVVAVLTKASPAETNLGMWNDWARNYSYLPVVNNLQAYLAGGTSQLKTSQVGSPLEWKLDAARYAPQVELAIPTAEGDSEILSLDATQSEEGLDVSFTETNLSGYYRLLLKDKEGKQHEKMVALNVEPTEGEMAILSLEQLAPRLPELKFKYYSVSNMDYETSKNVTASLSGPIMYLLLLILLCEQFVAYLLSYHPAKVEGARR